MRRLTQCLAGKGANIDDVWNEVCQGRFIIIFHITMPRDVDFKDVQQCLKEAGEELGHPPRLAAPGHLHGHQFAVGPSALPHSEAALAAPRGNTMPNSMRDYYRENPLMVSSPFGGVQGINRELLGTVFGTLDIGVEGRHILDVGCGRGYLGEYVREHGGSYTGVDLVLGRAGFRLALADAGQLPFPARVSFDGVCCIDAFEHIPGPEAAAAEFRRVLRPGGFLFLSAPNYGNVAGIVKGLYEGLGLYRENTWAPFRQWQPQELEHALTNQRVRQPFQEAGFTNIKYIGHGAEVGMGVCPWIEHPRMPEAAKFRLQRFFNWVGPDVVGRWPGASLHSFWRMEVDAVDAVDEKEHLDKR